MRCPDLVTMSHIYPGDGERMVRGMAKKLSNVATVNDSGLACPKCHSTAFRAKRSLKGKLAMGVLAPKTRVECLVCKKEYRRG